MYYTPIFFDPNNEFVDWLGELSKDRVIMDIGYGSGHTLKCLSSRGFTKLVGIDPYSDASRFIMDWRVEGMDVSRPHVFQEEIGTGIHMSLLKMGGDKLVCFLCRPCHHPDLVHKSYEVCRDNNIELYYIGLENNIQRDLDEWDIPYTRVEHKGKSKENEIVLKLV